MSRKLYLKKLGTAEDSTRKYGNAHEDDARGKENKSKKPEKKTEEE